MEEELVAISGEVVRGRLVGVGTMGTSGRGGWAEPDKSSARGEQEEEGVGSEGEGRDACVSSTGEITEGIKFSREVGDETSLSPCSEVTTKGTSTSDSVTFGWVVEVGSDSNVSWSEREANAEAATAVSLGMVLLVKPLFPVRGGAVIASVREGAPREEEVAGRRRRVRPPASPYLLRWDLPSASFPSYLYCCCCIRRYWVKAIRYCCCCCRSCCWI